MNICSINYESFADGPGVRIVIFVSGCKHHCRGCQNPETHSFDSGYPFSDSVKKEIIQYIGQHEYISGITLSGGDPMYHAKELKLFLNYIKNDYPNLSIWLYTGFVYEEIIKDKDMKELLELCDVVIDGPFILAEHDATLAFRGSSNQRVIDVKQSLTNNKVIEYQL